MNARRYARLSGDWSPIHLTGWSARLMGLRAPIIHGMHTLSPSCAALEKKSDRHVAAITCRFRSPVTLESKVTLRAGTAPGDFIVEADGKLAITGHGVLT